MCEATWKEIDQAYCETPLQSLLGDQPLIKRHIDADLFPVLMKVPIEIWHSILKCEKPEKVPGLYDGLLTIRILHLQTWIRDLHSGHIRL